MYNSTHLLYPFLCSWALRLLPCLAVINSATMNIGVRVSFWTMFFSGYVARNGIARSYGSSMISTTVLDLNLVLMIDLFLQTDSSWLLECTVIFC